MHRLGISVYPHHSNPEADLAYMQLAAKYGFTRLFTCMLSMDETKEEILEHMTTFCKQAHELGFIVSVDTNPAVFEKIGATPLDLSLFNQMGIDIIRLDGHFDDIMDTALTINPYNIKIEFNGSQYLNVDRMIEKGANPQNMTICHNFYPQRYSALSEERYYFFNSKFEKLGLERAAFVSSNTENSFGPWPVSDGLPTLEICRDKDISWQTRYLFATKAVEDVFVGNAYASEGELKAMSEVNPDKITLKIDLAEGISDFEKDIIFNGLHLRRSDCNDLIVRSSMPRRTAKDVSIKAIEVNKEYYEVGDVLIVNDNLQYYRGELEIVTKPIKNTHDRNIVGHLNEDEMKLVSMLGYEHFFGFIK